MLVLFTDTDCDFTPELAAEYGYHLISMPYSVNGENINPYEDFDKFDAHAFYDMLRAGTIPNTSALSPAKYVQYFEPIFENGDDILYVHFSAAMSATFDNMHIALNELKEKYPDRRFYEIDTKGITILGYTVACEIGRMYKNGATVGEMLAWAEAEVDHYAVYFFSEDLKFFHHSGRVSGIQAFMGTLVGVRPIIYMNAEGKMVSVGKERGRRNAVLHLLKRMEELGDHVADHPVVIGHTDTPELADLLTDMIHERFGDGVQVESFHVNPTAGSHCGPDCMGVCFHALHR